MTDSPRLLVVEDNPQLASILRLAFQYQGFQVVEAENGQAALEACHDRQERFDVILMDLQMPVMDGLTATRLLRAHPDTRDSLVICLSANLDTVDQQDELGTLFNETLRKPVSPRELVKLVTAKLAERGVHVPDPRVQS